MSNSKEQSELKSEILPGAYSLYSCKIDEHAKEAFKEAFMVDGIKYTAVAVSIQIVAGTNYNFFCNVQLSEQPLSYCAIVSIFKPLDGTARITKIQDIR